MEYIWNMGTELPIESKRFRLIREEHQYTQTDFADLLGIRNSTADIERGKTRLSGKVVAKLLQQFRINPLWLFGESNQKFLQISQGDVSPKVISLDSGEKENIMLVNVKAAA